MYQWLYLASFCDIQEENLYLITLLINTKSCKKSFISWKILLCTLVSQSLAQGIDFP